MITELIIAAAIAAVPTIASVAGIFTAIGKFIKSLNELKTEVSKTKEYEELKSELKLAHKENLELKKKINEILIAINKVQIKEEE